MVNMTRIAMQLCQALVVLAAATAHGNPSDGATAVRVKVTLLAGGISPEHDKDEEDKED